MAAAERQKLPVLRITHKALEKRCRRLEESEAPTPHTNLSSDALEGTSTENDVSSAASDGFTGNPSRTRSDRGSSEPQESGGGLLHIKPTNPQKSKRSRSSNSCDSRSKASASKSPARSHVQRGKGSRDGGGSERSAASEGCASSRRRGTGKEPSGCSTRDVHLAEWKRFTDGKIKRNLARWTGDEAKLKQIIQMGENLQAAGEHLLLNNLEVSTKQEVGSKMWKLAHYPIIESLRKQTDESLKGELVKFLESTTQFYSSLVDKLQSRYQFQLQQLLSGETEFHSKTHHRTVMMAVHVCEWCYICLGDCSRYQQQLSTAPNWTQPQNFYLTAQQLAPKDGKPYNQLAVVALNSHLRLDAVYYYMRSLTAKNPFQSAHDSLVGLFEDTSRKAKKQEMSEKMAAEKAEKKALGKQQKMEKRRQRKLRHQQKHSQKHNHSNKGRHVLEFPSGRKEVWIFPSSNQGRSSVNSSTGMGNPKRPSEEGGGEVHVKDVQFGELTSSELVKKLISAFLVVHGKIFTKIGIEMFEHSREKLLQLWACVLKKNHCFDDALLFLKMMLISIFSIHSAAENYHEHEAMQYYCGLGISLALHLTTTLLSTCVTILDDTTPSSLAHTLETVSLDEQTLPQGQTSEEINQQPPLKLSAVTTSLAVLLPSVRVWFEWLTHQQQLCKDCLPSVPVSTIHEFWETTCTFLNKAHSSFPSISDESSSKKSTQLWEDRILAGFMPLKSMLSVQDIYCIKHVAELTPEQHYQQCLTRISQMGNTFKHLCSNGDSDNGMAWGGQTVLSFDATSREFQAKLIQHDQQPIPTSSCSEAHGEEESEHTAASARRRNSSNGGNGDEGVISTSSDSEDVIVEEGSSEEDDEGESEKEEETSSEIEHLKAQREILTKQIEEHDIAMETVKTVLSEATNKEIQEVHITPRYLVPDTNCFVDLLPSIKTLVESTHFTVVIPLVALAELEGLSKGALESSQKDNSARVTAGAKSALEYINAIFTAKNSHLNALTTQGSLLTSLSFRAELTDKASNDDLILESCVKLHSKVSKGRVNEKGIESYSVVLLTDDRNLRVKAHARNMPVRDTPEFMRLYHLHAPS